MHNNSRKINRKYVCIFEVFVVSPSLFRHVYLKIFYQYLAVQKKKFAKSGRYTLFFYFCLTNLDSSLTQKCQVLRQIWIIVSFLSCTVRAGPFMMSSWKYPSLYVISVIHLNCFWNWSEQICQIFLFKGNILVTTWWKTQGLSLLLCSADNIGVVFKIILFCVCRIAEVVFKMLLFISSVLLGVHSK